MLTKTQIKNYVKKAYGSCPRCKSRDIVGGSVEIDGNQAVQTVTCDDCELSWEDIYTLSDINIVYDPDTESTEQ